MILYDLNCENGHTFEAWFASSEQYDKQNKKIFLFLEDTASLGIIDFE